MRNKLMTWVQTKTAQITTSLVLGSMYFAQPTVVFATRTAGTDKITKLLSEWLAPWLTQIGGIVMLIGALQFALAFQRQDSESKSNAMLTIMAGAMVCGLSVAYSTFFS